MSTPTPAFFLASTEGYGMEEPRRCYPLKRLAGTHRDDYLLVRIEPPLIGQTYGLGWRDVHEVVLASRHKGSTLFPITSWPVYVHVARPLVQDPSSRESLLENELEEVAWAELYATEDAARSKT